MGADTEDADVETSSERYARRFGGHVGAFFLDRQAQTSLDLLRPFPGASILDVGGGHGQMAGPLVDAGHPLTVLGSGARCADRVRTWVEDGRARFQAGDLLALPFPDRAFDVTLSYRLLPHVTRWPQLVAELCRVARRAVLVDYPTRRSVNVAASPLFAAKRGVEGDTRPYRVFRDAEIEACFAERGFRATGRRPQFFFPMALHRALGVAPLSRAMEGAARAFGLVRMFGSPVILRLERHG